jgi:ribosomal protein S18 acetylase RimI-like enzyme
MTAPMLSAGDLIQASDSDVPEIVALMNRAYRGIGTERGWSAETEYIDGDRTNAALLRQDMAAAQDAALLLWRRAAGEPGNALLGCVWLEPLAGHVWYLGSLTIDPNVQDGGFGRTLLTASENWVRARGGRAVRMTVVNVRESLIAWYVRRGYRLTGETEPFPYDNPRFGVPKRPDLCFVVLCKTLGV